MWSSPFALPRTPGVIWRGRCVHLGGKDPVSIWYILISLISDGYPMMWWFSNGYPVIPSMFVPLKPIKIHGSKVSCSGRKFTESQDFEFGCRIPRYRVINHFISISCQPESKKAHDFKTRKKPCSICWTAAYCCHVAGATTGWRTHPTGFVGNPGGQEWCTWADSTQKWPRILEPTLETKIQPVSATIRIWTPLQRFTCATICH